MGTNSYTSVYVSKELKRQLVETARAEHYKVGFGRGSRLAEFIAVMLQEYCEMSQKDPLLHPLTPELRSLIKKLSRMDEMQQKRACKMLALLFDGQGSEQGAWE